MVRLEIYFIAFLVIADAALAAKKKSEESGSTSVDKRKKKKSDRSTSSESGDHSGSDEDNADSLSMSVSSGSSSSTSNKDRSYIPKSSAERRGWRKWHRKCSRCPEDARKKWRDPTIKWICGGYQRARRSFKSLCMMHYRNCQDGTMFVKLHEYRCANHSEGGGPPHGEHFFYEYRAVLSDDSSDSKTSDSSTETSENSDTFYV